ncbi:MAG: site-2 protease family protein [Rubricoccaceae bacterium]|nr:site-2 protease family protein [Rubricoccaceae bacterium]
MAEPPRERYGLHLGLFLLTLASTIWAGGLLIGRGLLYEQVGMSAFFQDGVRYAVPFLFFLTTHEFGHYFAARTHNLSVSLPYYIPIPLIGIYAIHLGTLGAVIRIREPFRKTAQLFDVGAAGPLAGFVVALGLLVVSTLTLPPVEYLLDVGGHEDVVRAVQETGIFPAPNLDGAGEVILFGDTPLFAIVRNLVPGLPSPSELMHYPLLLAAWLGLFFTALNLLPVGQLDGGHVVYALFGPKAHAIIARVVTFLLLISAMIGIGRDYGAVWYTWPIAGCVVGYLLWRIFDSNWKLVFPALTFLLAVGFFVPGLLPAVAAQTGYAFWLVWVALIVFVIRVDHPPVLEKEPLTFKRKLLGYLCLVIFMLCFSVQPIFVPV